jgi:sulfur-oxidizing protein SoxY
MKMKVRQNERPNPTRSLTRRDVLLTTLAMGAATLLGPHSALADLAEMDAEIGKFTGGAAAIPGRITIGLPELAENGNSVPISVAIDSPMTAEDYVTEVRLIADRNPRPVIATFHFSPMTGRAEVATRIRLAATQNVIVLVKTSRGEILGDRRQIKVTIGGCGG